MIPTPKNKLRRTLELPYSYEIGVAGFAVFAGFANAVRSFFPEAKFAWSGYVVGSLWVISSLGVMTLTILKAWVQWKAHEERQSTHDLAGCLHVLHALLSTTDASQSGRLRLTIYVPVNDGTHLQQLLEYVGGDYRGRKTGRQLPCSVGIVGLSYRTGFPYVAERQNQDSAAFVQELMEDWGYTQEGAAETDDTSHAWAAIPLGGEGDPVYGIVYADSTIPGFFGPAAHEMLLTARLGIADYVVKRYSKK